MSAVLLDAIARRNMFGIFRSALHSRKLPVAQGWEKTRHELEALLSNPAEHAETLTNLQDCYQDNVLFAQKTIVLWALQDTATATLIANSLHHFVDATSPYAEGYPLPLSEVDLGQVQRLCVPTAVHVHGDTVTLVLAGKRWFNEEVQVSADDLTDEARGEYRGLTELVGKRRVSYPVFDSITVNPMRRMVELRLDQTKYTTDAEILQYRIKVQNVFNKLVNDHCGIAQILGDPLNLYPAIDPLYVGNTWKVQAIEHTNDGGYLNKNRGRGRKIDVREDDYHSAGEGAVSAIHIHSLTATWDLQFGAPRLVLHGHSKILSSEHPHIDHAKILDAWDTVSYHQVLNTLVVSLGH